MFQPEKRTEESLEKKRERLIVQATQDLMSGEFTNKPDQYADNGLIIRILEDGQEIGHVTVSRDYKKEPSTVTEIHNFTFVERNQKGEVQKYVRYNKDASFRGTTEYFDQDGDLFHGILERDSAGQIISREGYTSTTENIFTREYFDENNRLAGKLIQERYDRANPKIKILGQNGQELKLDRLAEYEWNKNMNELVSRKAY